MSKAFKTNMQTRVRAVQRDQSVRFKKTLCSSEAKIVNDNTIFFIKGFLSIYISSLFICKHLVPGGKYINERVSFVKYVCINAMVM